MRNPSSASAAQLTKTPCCSKVGLKKGPWTPEEDELLANYISKKGEGQWRTLPKRAGLLRCGKSCRLRWMNYLRPNVKRGQITPDEEDLILRLHRLLGNRWSLIAGRIPGRTDNEIKNYWNAHLSKKLISQWIDPRTHKPLKAESPDKLIKAASSKANQKAVPIDKPNLVSSGLEATISDDTPIIGSKESEILQNTSFEDRHTGTTSLIGNTSLMNCEGSWIDFTSNQELGNEEAEDRGVVDDVFSSFLNSLINDEAFSSQQHQMQGLPSRIIPDPSLSATTSAFGLRTGRESPLVASSTNQNGPSMVDDHME